jgi:predicted RecB family nuclease
MHLEADHLHFRATDLSTYSACQHATLLDRAVESGTLDRPHRNDPAIQLLAERGTQHENRYRDLLQTRHGEPVFRVPGAIPKTAEQWQDATARTLEAMQAGHRVIYQAPLARAGWHGLADFLVRVPNPVGEKPNVLGDYHYEVVDTKLAQEARGSAILQLCVYSEIVSILQGRAPDHLVVASPAGVVAAGESPEPKEHKFRTADFLAYFRLIRERFAQFAEKQALDAVYPEPVEHCDVCDWWSKCDRRRRDDDHLSLVAGMGRGHRKLLDEAGVSTLAALGKLQLPMADRPHRLPREPLERLHHQARLQLEARSDKPRYEMLPVESGRGLGRLPPPSPGDLFFDIEADRYAIDGTFHYLLGWVEADDGGKSAYQGLWSNNRHEERMHFESFVDLLVERRQRHPDMHVYHFAPMEKTALGELAARYASREEAVDDLFRNEVLVDLMPVVKQGLRAGIESYSIKELERFYGYERQTDLRAASQARRLFELNRETGNVQELPEVVPTVEAYNREDCESTLHLQRWLEERRAALVAGGGVIPRPELKNEAPKEELSAWARRVEKIREGLLQGLAADPEQRTPGETARQLLADLVDWHRRDAKPGWREYFRIRGLTEEELVDESGPIGGLGPEVCKGRIPGPGSKSDRYEYAFPPQEYGIKLGDVVECPVTRQTLGTVIEVNRDTNTVAVKRTTTLERPARAMAEKNDEPQVKAIQGALAQIAETLTPDFGLPASAEGELAIGKSFSAARDLLLRNAPRLEQRIQLQLEGESAADATQRIAPQLSGTLLAVQGPPGAGKTHAGSQMILELVRAGKKVGITAPSHPVIENFLEAIHEAAQQAHYAGNGLSLLSIQKPKDGTPGFEHPHNGKAKKAADVARSLQSGEAHIAAGTAWLWCDEELRNSVDVLVVDEAGQFSLANALAVSAAAQSLVLLGDPQQLAQPSQGGHPLGAEASALEHILGDEATLPTGKGLFMDRTWRLPPAIADFTSQYFYAGRLKAHPDCSRQVLRLSGAAQRFSGTGLFFEPVAHTGNVNSSVEEAERVGAIVSELLASGATWVNRCGEEQKLTLNDVLVVAPYNSQVQLIAERLAAAGYPGARVGTVDKFQGQEAPVVLYSMATSNPEDAPRGFDFLFSLNRLNVATSRAQAIVILVASPRLLEAQCKTPKQMRLVNAFCGAVGEAGRLDVEGGSAEPVR